MFLKPASRIVLRICCRTLSAVNGNFTQPLYGKENGAHAAFSS
tara:strand:+ start:1384 stop:1512 length:129 start_codon:yes stop_codon:yes gene_type:complete